MKIIQLCTVISLVFLTSCGLFSGQDVQEHLQNTNQSSQSDAGTDTDTSGGLSTATESDDDFESQGISVDENAGGAELIETTTTTSAGTASQTVAVSTVETFTQTTAAATGTESSTSSSTSAEAATATATEVAWDFSEGSLPAAVSSSTCELTASGLKLPQDASGAYSTNCFFDIGVSYLAGKQVLISKESANQLVATDFSLLSADDIGLYNPASAANLTPVATGKWLSNARWPSQKPSITTDSSGKTWAKINSQGSLLQLTKITPGDEYELSYELDPSALTIVDGTPALDQQFYFTITFYDQDYKKLTFLDPITNTASTSLVAKAYTSSSTERDEQVRIKTIDCDHDYVKYRVGEGTATSDETFNHCRDSSGNPLTNEDGTVYSNPVYMGIEFSANWKGNDYGLIRLPRLVHRGEIETQLLDASGAVLSSSTDTDGFVVEGDMNPSILRVNLSSNNTTESPVVSVVRTGNRSVTLSIGEKIATFTKPRLGFTSGISPSQDWCDYGNGSNRSLCLDLANEEIKVNCWKLLKTYGVGRWRNNIQSNNFEVTLSGTTYNFDFYMGSYNNRPEPVSILNLMAEAAYYGMEILLILDTVGDGEYWWGDTKINFWDSTTGYLNDQYDPTPADDSDDEQQSIELMKQWAAYQARLFNGSNSYTFSDGTSISLPRITYFQIGVEDNISPPVFLSSEVGYAQMQEDVAAAVLGITPQAVVETSINPSNNVYTRTIDYDFVEEYLGLVNSGMTHFGFNMFSQADRVIPEDWFRDLEALNTQDYFSYWQNKTMSVGAFDFTYERYDPACDTSWEEGFGEKSAAKLTARTVLTALSMNVEDIYDYVIFDSEGYSGLNLKATADSCRLSNPEFSTSIFNRVSGTGILSGNNEPSQYRVNDVGRAFLTIGKNVSASSPYRVSVAGDSEDVYASYLENTAGEKFVAVWHAPRVEYALDYMSYVSEYKEQGLTQEVLLDVILDGAADFSAATRIDLAGGSDENLVVNGATISGIRLDGDMPTLIKLQ